MSLLLRGCWKLRVALFSSIFASSFGPAVVLAAPAGVTLWQFGEGRLLSGGTTLPLIPQGTHTAKDGSGSETTYLYQAVGQHAVPTVVGDVVTTQTVQSTGTRTLVVSASGWYEPFSVTTGAPTASQLAFIQCGFAAGDPGFGECFDGKPNGQTVLANSGLPTPVVLAVGTGGEGKAKDNGSPATATTDTTSPSTLPSDSSSPPTSSSASSSTSASSSNSRVSASIIAAAALSSIISTLLVFALVFWLCRRRRVRQAVFRDNLKATPFVLEQELPRSAASQSQSQSQTQAWTQAQRAQYQFGFMGPHSESSVSAGAVSGRVEGRDNMFGFAFPAAARPTIRDDAAAHPYLHHAPGQGPRTTNRTSTGTLSSISDPEMAMAPGSGSPTGRYLRYSSDKMPGARGSVLRDAGEDERALPGYR
ncbi:hypothetical protein HMN09_00370500 [Mycena chlorophos]|uniref:Uncharacterized protein n=1 Tax=Mycena chlorophos TaxID=658473 RepID=A0A8H6TKV8_MYCCL|nr:hypothetical protein HMN09_00370500 [Mycena chlorophos]